MVEPTGCCGSPFCFQAVGVVRLNILAFGLGVLLLQLLPSLPRAPDTVWSLAIILAGAVVAAWVLRRQVFFRTVLVALICAVLGFAWAAWRADQRLADSLPKNWEGRDIELIGVVAELPQTHARGVRFTFQVESVLTEGASVPPRIMLSWYQGRHDGDALELPAVHPGERWRLSARLRRPHGNANPHGFDYEAWLLERGIRATGYVRSTPVAERLDGFVPSAETLVERAREQIRARFLAVLPEHEFAGVLVALTVGDQKAIQGELWNVFSRTGTTHLMSISGLHVTMVAALVAWCAGGLWRRGERLVLHVPAQRAAVLAGWIAALVYALLSGFSVPAQRTFYMLSVGALALLLGRGTAPSRTLLLALLVVLVLDPWAVLAPGFWLSFGAVALLFYVAVSRIGDDGGWRAALAGWGSAQWAVTVGSVPLLLLFFQQFSLVSPLANAIAIPVVSFVITPLALLAAILPIPGLLQIDHWLMSLLMQGLVWLADWPVFMRSVPPLWAVVLALIGVVWCLLPRGFPSRWLGLVLLAPALLLPSVRPEAGAARVTVLDVGQGLAVLVQTHRHDLLYDTGPLYSAESDAGQRIVVPFLRAQGINRLDTLIVTHADSDHAGGAGSVLAALPVNRILSSLDDAQGEACAAGQRWTWDDVRFEMLHPAAGDVSAKKTNNRSCVLRIEAKGCVMLLTSDIEARDEAALLARDRAALKADVLLAPHHCSRTSSTAEFLAAVGATEAIFPVGYLNRFGHPRADVVARYGDARQWRTDRDGAITVDLGEPLAISAWRRERVRYWHSQ